MQTCLLDNAPPKEPAHWPIRVYGRILRTAWILDKNIWVYAPQEEKSHSAHTYLVEGIELPLFMKVHIMENLTWGKNTVELEKNAEQRADVLSVLSRNDMPQKLLVFYGCSLRAHWLTVCVGLVPQLQVWAALQGVIRVAQKRPGCPHPTWWGASALNTNTDWKEFQPTAINTLKSAVCDVCF